MNVVNIPGNGDYQKKVAGTERLAAPVRNIRENGSKQKIAGDDVNVSSKAKLLLWLRKNFNEIDSVDRVQKAAEVKERLAEGVHKLSSEEIVQAILRGTFFESY